jgi:hypothetical protein
MRYYYRLAAPGAAFAGIGILLLVLAPLPNFTLIGGLTTSGGYALAIEVVLSMFLLATIDDLQQPLATDAHASVGDAVNPGARDITPDIRSALRDFYRKRPLPALLLGFGLSTSVAALLIGAFEGVSWMVPTEVVIAVILVLSSVVQLPTVGRGFFGWTVGFTLGSGIALHQFEREVNRGPQTTAWLALVAGLWALGGIAYGVKAARNTSTAKCN